MRRLLPLLVLAFLPAAGAAPVPPAAGRPTFGANGLVTRAELEKVKFEPRIANERDRRDRIAHEDRKPNRGFEKAAVAVHLPWHTFREGEPIPAYFVFKNGGDQPVSLDARLDLFGPRPTTWNSCSVSIFNVKTGKPVHTINGAGWMCGGPPLVVVPANGFYCVGCDLGREDGKPIPPGEYEVDWRYAWLRSAGVRFTVEKAEGVNRAAVKRPGVHFYHIAPDHKRQRFPAKAGDPFLWDDSRLESISAGEMTAALAVGHAGVYVPNVHNIPAADDLIESTIQWKPYRDGDRVAITLTSRDPQKPVRFADVPQFYLQIESEKDEQLEKMAEEFAKELQERTVDALVTPLTIEARLPDSWRVWGGVPGPARVAVMVTSRKVELPRDQWGLEKAKELRRDRGPTWEGVVRTPFVEVRFPALK